MTNSYNAAWMCNLTAVKQFANSHHAMPSRHAANADERTLGVWVHAQKSKFKKHLGRMKDDNTRKVWQAFVAEYAAFFTSNNAWLHKFDRLQKFIMTHKKLPDQMSSTDADEMKLGMWLHKQKALYRTQTEGMQDKWRQTIWKELLDANEAVFAAGTRRSDWHTEWSETLDRVQQFIDVHGKLPTQVYPRSDDSDALGSWLARQLRDTDLRAASKRYQRRQTLWVAFINKNVEVFQQRNCWQSYLDKHAGLFQVPVSPLLQPRKRPRYFYDLSESEADVDAESVTN